MSTQSGMSHAGMSHAGMRVRPPVLLLLTIGISGALSLLAPLPIFRRALVRLMGLPLLGAGFGLLFSAIRQMRQMGVEMRPGFKPNHLVTQGPFRFTRNPIYLGMTLAYSGLGLLANTFWFIPFAAAFMVILQTQVIRREETLLEAMFGEEYRQYQRQVRRWV